MDPFMKCQIKIANLIKWSRRMGGRKRQKICKCSLWTTPNLNPLFKNSKISGYENRSTIPKYHVSTLFKIKFWANKRDRALFSHLKKAGNSNPLSKVSKISGYENSSAVPKYHVSTLFSVNFWTHGRGRDTPTSLIFSLDVTKDLINFGKKYFSHCKANLTEVPQLS